jgi:hypothetical protein
VARRGAHAVGHRVDVGVNPGADVLQVDDQRVDTAQHLPRWLTRLAVEGIDRHPAARVVAMGRLDHVVLHVRTKSVLGAENRAELHTVSRRHLVDHVPEIVVDRSVVTNDADPGTFQPA